MSRPKLIIIPGIGDRSHAYTFFAFAWHLMGFDVHILPFGWIYPDARLTVKTEEFLRLLGGFGKEPLHIIGVSAGGVAAVRIFARVNSVDRIITVGTPFKDFPDLKNRLLADSISGVREDLSRLSPGRKQRILSVHGLYDQVVPVHMSQPKGVRTLRVWAVLHALIILIALTCCGLRLRRFLRTGE
ncbi:MAG: hypothetical protein AAB834_08070 [Patescibacteria group bacterium]